MYFATVDKNCVINIFTVLDTQTETKFMCPRKCGRSYKWKCSLTAHLRYECGVPKQFKCLLCQKLFAHNKLLRAHTAVVHGCF